MNSPRYSYSAINTLALSDTGHFVFLDAWSISLLASMLSQNMPLWFWTNNQFPLTQAEIDDLEAKLAAAGGQLQMQLVGMVMPITTFDLPIGTLLCDGSTYLRADYPNLYDALDPAFIIDADSFSVPDMQDRFVMGSSTTIDPGDTGGSTTVTQTIAQMPIHSHTNTPHTHADTPHTHAEGIALPSAAPALIGVPIPSAIPGVGITGPASVGIVATTITIDNTGGGEPMTITPPFIALRYVVVAL